MTTIILYFSTIASPLTDENNSIFERNSRSAVSLFLESFNNTILYREIKEFPRKLKTDIVLSFDFDNQKENKRPELCSYMAVFNSAENEIEPSTTTFYFVERAEYVAKNIYRFYLKLDVLNTFTDIIFSKNSNTYPEGSAIGDHNHFLRRHKDRLLPIEGEEDSYTFVVDRLSEGVNPPKYFDSISPIFSTQRISNSQSVFYSFDWSSEKNEIPVVKAFVAMAFDEHGHAAQKIAIDDQSVKDSLPYSPLAIGARQKAQNINYIPYFPFTAVKEEYVNGVYQGIFKSEGANIAFETLQGGPEGRYFFTYHPALELSDLTIPYKFTPFVNRDFDFQKLHNNKFTNLSIYRDDLGNIDPDKLPNNDLFDDPKLFHSDFETNIFQYSASKTEIKNENFIGQNTIDDSIGVYPTFFLNNDMTNSAVFTFLAFSGEVRYAKEEIDDLYLFVENLGSFPEFKNSYQEYKRNGAFYDALNYGLNQTQGIFNTVVGSGGDPIKLATDAVGNAFNAVQGIINIEQKKQNLKNQATQITNSSLTMQFQVYNRFLNKIKYKCSKEIKDAMSNIFKRYGYRDNSYGPLTFNRQLFDFIQCNLDVVSAFASKEIVDEVVRKFKEGVTIYHAVDDVFYTNMKKENFERTVAYPSGVIPN